MLFQYLPPGGTGPPAALGDVTVGVSRHGVALPQVKKLELAVNVIGTAVSFEFMTELFDESTMARLLGSYLLALQQAAADPGAPALSARLMRPADEGEVATFCCGQLRPAYLDRPSFPHVFAEAAVRHFGRPCLVFEGAEMSYGQVAEAAAALAATLAGMGLGPGVTVGIMLDRSFELVVAILGVMRSGGEGLCLSRLGRRRVNKT